MLRRIALPVLISASGAEEPPLLFCLRTALALVGDRSV